MPKFIFAAARDGEAMLSDVFADTEEEAQRLALKEAAANFGLGLEEGETADDFEGQLDGFVIHPWEWYL